MAYNINLFCILVSSWIYFNMKKSHKQTFAISVLRRASRRYKSKTSGVYPQAEALNRARITRGLYQCAICKNSFKKKETILDHIEPVVDVTTGFTTLDEYVERLLVEPEGYQVLCETDHAIKCSIEADLRKKYRNKSKKLVAKRVKK